MEWNSHHSPWINENKIRCKGGLFIIESGHTVLHFFQGSQFPSFVRKRFPNLIDIPVQSFPWYRNHTQQNPIKVRFALLPPNESDCNKK